MRYEYIPEGVCAGKIEFGINDGKVNGVKFIGGCGGNSIGISRLVEGMNVDEVIGRLENVKCGGKPTSCPAQLAKALRVASGSGDK